MATIGIIDATVGVETFRAQDGGCLGYLVVDEASHTAWAIDPPLDQVGDLLDTVNARGLGLTQGVEPHTHPDHSSGVARLAGKTGAVVLAHAASKLKHAARRI